MGKFNRHGKVKKENNSVDLQCDNKLAKDVPPQVAELVEAGV